MPILELCALQCFRVRICVALSVYACMGVMCACVSCSQEKGQLLSVFILLSPLEPRSGGAVRIICLNNGAFVLQHPRSPQGGPQAWIAKAEACICSLEL